MEKRKLSQNINSFSHQLFLCTLSLTLSFSFAIHSSGFLLFQTDFYCFKLSFCSFNFLLHCFLAFLCFSLFSLFFYRILLLLTLCSFLLLSIFSFFLNVSHPVSLLFYAVSYCFFLVISYSLFLFKLFLSSLFLLFFLILFYIFRKLFYPFLLPLSHSF